MSRLVIAFSEPPDHFGFVRAKSGKCWHRKVDSIVFAKQLARQLSNLGIHGVIKNTGGQNRNKRPRVPTNPIAETGHGGFGGLLNAMPITGTWRLRQKRK